MAIKWQTPRSRPGPISRKPSRMWRGRLLRACLVTLALCGRPRGRRAAGPGQFRSSGRRLPEFAGRLGRSGGLRAGMRTRPALPRLELQLSDRCRQRRGMLAEEQRAGACAGQLLRFGRARRRRGRTEATARSKPRSTAPAATTTASTSRAAKATRPARRPAPPTTSAGPGPMRAPGYVGRERALLPEKGNQAAAPQGRVYLRRGAVGYPRRCHSGMILRSHDADVSKLSAGSMRSHRPE